MSKIYEFTTEEEVILALGWHEALLLSRIAGCPVSADDIVLLDILTRSSRGTVRDYIAKSIDALELCAVFYQSYYVSVDLNRDTAAFLDEIYPIHQDCEMIKQRFNSAQQLLSSKIK